MISSVHCLKGRHLLPPPLLLRLLELLEVEVTPRLGELDVRPTGGTAATTAEGAAAYCGSGCGLELGGGATGDAGMDELGMDELA